MLRRVLAFSVFFVQPSEVYAKEGCFVPRLHRQGLEFKCCSQQFEVREN